MIEQGVNLFDKFIVAIGVNPDKRATFSVEERLAMLRASTSRFSNLQVTSFDYQFLIDYARSASARFILRGIRSESDYEYERVMRNINGDLNPDVTTVFLMPPRGIAEVSSSMVRGLIGPKNWKRTISRYVPPAVYSQLVKKFDARAT